MARLQMRLAALPLVALVMLATPMVGAAQTKQDREQVTPAPTLVLTGNVRGVRSDATTSRLLAIEILDVQVRIRGSVAETRMTATFRNSSSDVLEGDFAFDMPAGSVITGYALDVGPDMIDGVLAGRDRAREAYQRRVVQRIDPGLAEVTWSDRFSTRIFPIPAQGSRTIRLVMTSPLDPVQGYVLPMRPAGPVGRLTLRIESDDGTPPNAVLPTGITGTWDGGRLSVDAWEARLGGELRLPPLAEQAPITVSRHANGEEFFEIGRRVQLGSLAGGELPAKVHIFWDRSASRADDDVAAERALILAYLEASRAESVTLTLFDSGASETVRVASFSDLAERLSGVRYIGGTSFARLSDVAVEDGATCLLVSDGRATIDSRGGFGLPCRTSAISSGREVDRGWLSHVASRSGGRFVELGSMTRDAALSALLEQSVDVGRLVDDSGRTVEAVALADGGRRIRLVGPMPMSGGLRLMRGNQVVQSFARPPIAAPLFSGPGALWASRRIAADSNELRTEELVALSRRYSVASPLASFIVLEQPADYVEANIPPPQSYPKALHDQYAAMRTAADQQIAAQQAGRLQQVATQWDAIRAWWNQRFDARAQRRERDRQAAALRGENIPWTAPPPPPPPPPPSPPPPPPPSPTASPVMGGSDEEQSIVVTAQRIQGNLQDVPVAVSAISAEEMGSDASGEVANDRADADAGQVPSATRSAPDVIQTAEWSPGRPWIVAIDAAGAGWADEVERQRVTHGALPLFWYDLAEWHWRNNRPAEARRAVESALDLPSRDNQTLEIVAGRLVRYGDLDRALALYAQLADREDERPQPLRQQALVLMARAEAHRVAGRTEAARSDLHQAIALFSDAVLKVRRERYGGFETTALMDANLAVQRFRALGGRDHALPQQLVTMLDTDIRVVVEWNTPRTDLDLWVQQPNGERVGFSSRLSAAGGRLTWDVTNGFGPEEFLIRAAPRGTYTIEIDSFASDRTNPNGPSTVQARIIRNFGRPNQSEELVDVEMDPTDDGMRRVGTVEVR